MLNIRECWEILGSSCPSKQQERRTPEVIATLLPPEQAAGHLPLHFADLTPTSHLLHLGSYSPVGIF